MTRLFAFLFAFFLAIPGSYASEADSLFRTGNRHVESDDPYLTTIQPILAKYCVSCHSCTNGPCQLNLTSYQGLARGVLNVNPYKSLTLGTPDTRLSNNWSLENWRKLGFRSVLPAAVDGIAPQDSLLYLSLTQEKPSDLQLFRELARKNMDQDYQCPTDKETYLRLSRSHKIGGMPWGLSGIPDESLRTLLNWIEDGAPGPSAAAAKALRTPMNSSVTKAGFQAIELVRNWEDFLNRDDIRYQLVGRYIYEHSFLAHIQMDENPGEFYQIVRSRSRFPATIDRITTELPTDHPGSGRVFYRLEKIDRVIEAKTHTVWKLNQAKISYFEKLFQLDKGWPLAKLPGYDSTNPFIPFEAIPVMARARFMVQESFLINQSIARGPICFDQAAANGVDEYFWKWFLAPEADPTVLEPKLGLSSFSDFYPEFKEQAVIRDDLAEHRYRRAFEKTLRKWKPDGLGIKDIWTGDDWQPDGAPSEKNPNAWLAVYRHQFTAEVLNGKQASLQGLPRSVQIISYAAHERIYYNEAVRFRYWGNSLHKLDTWNWVMATRTESEDLYASMFSSDRYRQSLRNRMTNPLFRIFTGLEDYAKHRPMIPNEDENEESLARTMFERMGEGVTGPADRLNNWPLTDLPKFLPDQIRSLEDWEQGLRTLTGPNGLNARDFARFVPNLVHIRLAGTHLYTLSVNRGYNYTKRSEPGFEKASRLPANDRLHALRGFFGVSPYLYLDLSWTEAAAFLRDLSRVKSVADMNALRKKSFVIRRDDPRVWTFTEWLHQKMIQDDPASAGILDLRFYDAEDQPF